MELFKIVALHDKVIIKILTYNSRVWCERQWAYHYVVENSYPSDYLDHATDFKTVEAAQKWIDERV